jgi:hypothetical protein
MTHKNRKKSRIFMFLSTGCSLVRTDQTLDPDPQLEKMLDPDPESGSAIRKMLDPDPH